MRAFELYAAEILDFGQPYPMQLGARDGSQGGINLEPLLCHKNIPVFL